MPAQPPGRLVALVLLALASTVCAVPAVVSSEYVVRSVVINQWKYEVRRVAPLDAARRLRCRGARLSSWTLCVALCRAV